MGATLDIQVKDLHKSFAEQDVLRGLEMSIPSGQVTAVLGGSGTGKSVFLKHLIGLLKPDQGQIEIDGENIVDLGERDLMPLRRRFGMIFQGGALLASLTVIENVAMALIENGLASRSRAFEIAREKLALVGLEGSEDKFPSALSGGMQKRAAIARALTTDPECFLYDEPTAGLDPPRARQIEELILDVNRKLKATTIVVTHDMHLVESIADHVFMLVEGRVIFSGTPTQLKNETNPLVQEFIGQ